MGVGIYFGVVKFVLGISALWSHLGGRREERSGIFPALIVGLRRGGVLSLRGEFANGLMEAGAEDFCEEVDGISREVAFGPSPLGVIDDKAGKGAAGQLDAGAQRPQLRARFDLDGRGWLHDCATMKTASVRDLRNHYTSVLRWVSAGEDVLITQRGVVIARLSPETPQSSQVVNWASSPEVLRDRSGDQVLSAEQSSEILAEAGGRW